MRQPSELEEGAGADGAEIRRTDLGPTAWDSGGERMVIDDAPDPGRALEIAERRAELGLDDLESIPEVRDLAAKMAAEAVRQVITWLFAIDGKTSEKFSFAARLSVAQKRATVVAWLMRVDGISEHSLNHLAADLKCTRAALSAAAVLARDKWGLTSGGSKSATARKVYAARARRVWADRKSASRTRERNKSTI
jgi:hypothetical protein